MLLRLAHIVAHCHAHGVLHRDLKPADILVTRDGGLRITDFGLSHGPCGGGTPGYASPKQMAGRPGEASDDVHALGIICLEMITQKIMEPPHSPVAAQGKAVEM